MNRLQKPKALQPGDRIGLIAPSGPVVDPDRVDASIEKLLEFGFHVTVGKSCHSLYGYLSGDDETRANDINQMFADSNIDAIICLRGGYGTPRLLHLLDYEMIKKNPKLFAGYSDITALHIVFNQRCDLVTLHSPMPASDMLRDFDEFTRESFLSAISSTEPLGELKNPEGEEEIKSLVGGVARGPIVGGNLSLLAGTIGTPYEIDTKGKLLFIEEIEEEPYAVDRMLTQLKLAGKFADCNGVILGNWNNCVTRGEGRPSLSLLEIFNDVIVPAGKPIIYDVKAGHCKPTLTIPFGAEAILDADASTLTVVESALV